MNLSEKLEKYFTENGIQRKWLASKIGISPSVFFRVSSGKAKMPKKYWAKLIEITNGQITLYDLFMDKLDGDKELEVLLGKSNDQCIISLK